MGNWALKDIEAFAAKILRTYFCESNAEFMISAFAEDIVWLGAGAAQKAEGREAVTACFRVDDKEMMAFEMSDEKYETRDFGGGIYLCEGVSRLYAKAEKKLFMQMQQRVTFIFREKGEALEILHIHNSVPFSGIQAGELFPIEEARKQYAELEDTLHRKNIEYERQAQFLAQLYNTVPCGIVQFLAEEEYRIVNVNRMGWQMYGYSSEAEYRQEVRGLLQLVLDKDKSRVEGIIRKLSDDGKIISYVRDGTRKDGKKIWISVFMAKVVNADGLEVNQAVFTDISEMKDMEEAQERERLIENRSLRAAICTAYPLILSVNLTRDTYNCFIEEQSAYFIERKGTYSGLIQNVLERVYPSYREDFAAAFEREEVIRRFKSGEHEIYMEYKQEGIDGKYHWIAINMIYVENPFSNEIIAIELVKNLDNQVAEQLRQEQFLWDALASAKAANQAKSDFLSRMSHDIRTPMNAIIGMTAIGQIKDDVEGMKDCFSKIDISSRYLLSLINDILDMSKIETGKMEIACERFDLTELIEEINQIIFPQAFAKTIEYEVCHKEPLDRYYLGDSLRIRQIMMNLLSNALKFTPEGGKIQIEIREQRRANGFSYLQFIIKDTGIGISDEFRQKMFQPFEQESKEGARNNVGSGLGLSIVYNLARLMGGTVEVESKKDKGTAFNVIIPVRLVSGDAFPKTEGKEALERKRSGRSDFSKCRVLLAEDNDLNREIAQTLLEMNGITVEAVQNGQEAVETFAQKEKGYYQAILMDIRMPVMDGLEAAGSIRALKKEDAGTVPILAMTANAFAEDKMQAMAAGMNGYLVKPLDIKLVLDTLKEFL